MKEKELRDEFAMAIAGHLAAAATSWLKDNDVRPESMNGFPEYVAGFAYEIADACMKEREKSKAMNNQMAPQPTF